MLQINNNQEIFTVVRHSQDGDLGDGSITAFNTTGTLVDGSQIRVHVTRETTTTGHLFTGGRDLTQSLSVRGHVGQDDEDVLLALVSQEFSGSERQTRRNDTLDGRIIGQVQEETHVLHGTVLFKVLLEETGSFHVDTHSGEDDGKVIVMIVQHRFTGYFDQTTLTTNLSGNLKKNIAIQSKLQLGNNCNLKYLIVGETGGREDGNLLATSDRVHDVNSRDTRLNHFLRVNT